MWVCNCALSRPKVSPLGRVHIIPGNSRMCLIRRYSRRPSSEVGFTLAGCYYRKPLSFRKKACRLLPSPLRALNVLPELILFGGLISSTLTPSDPVLSSCKLAPFVSSHLPILSRLAQGIQHIACFVALSFLFPSYVHCCCH